ncbi:Serine/threonine-protein kinase ssp1 [Pseudocercospora fuligena]|uniref:non-specific serine/threonine protein kinase n=1 Tax=Pseudocercospora fuligena TaxID=685502 RepID=A0A8H6VG90_9PEZI|nr:Serine/threonine-protein kinase ssp1 [Pseudocercospora fuligena]
MRGPHVNTFSSAIASHYGRPHRGIQTSHNSPAITPSPAGLFNPQGPASAVPLETESDASGTYASPFLHFTHTHAPKETHTADVDIDPVSGRKVINNYEIMDELGRGTHGKVKLGRDLYHRENYVAIKIVERFSKRRKLGRLGTTEDKVKKEVAILKKARHPNVVALLEVIDDPSRKKVYIVLEWVEKGEIIWRTKGPKEIAMVEARRYNREKSGHQDERKAAEDRAVLDEAKKRLQKEKRRRLRTLRRSRRRVRDDPTAWSIEMTGDDLSDDSDDDDSLSRISSMSFAGEMDNHTAPSQQQWLDAGLGRRPSRTPTPLQPALDTAIAHPSRFLRLTAEPETLSPVKTDPTPMSAALASSLDHLTGLEGTMYGAYEPVHGASSRVASLPSSLRGSQHGSTEGLSALADEVLDSELDSDLEFVPVMTMEQIRVAFRDTLLGLQYLHYQGIIHRDIKPPNLLSTAQGRVKISDFGVSYLGRPVGEGEHGEDVSEAEAHDQDEAKELAKTVGTPAFYAPELCSTDPADEPLPVTKAIDVWALGITLFCMLFARTPFVDDQYVVMRQIADEEVYIPKQRLQPTEPDKPKSQSSSRASSQARNTFNTPASKRNPLDFAYENLGDELHDLLSRLLIKDPRDRITLEEVRHHPWVLADLPEQHAWLEETDPTRQAEKKIEISKDEINAAVVPLNLMERVKSVVKGVSTKLGLGTKRERSQSSASQPKDGSPGPSAHSSSSTISSDARRMSIRPEQIVSALQSSHDQHPLSKSVAASPESDKASRRVSRLNGHSDASHRLSRVTSRPTPHRAMTVHSATESMRTVTQSDFDQVQREESPPPSPGLPGTPQALATPGGSALGGLLGGAARMVNRVRESSRQRSRQRRGPTSETSSVHSSDPYAEATLAVSDATAAGHVHQPETLRGEFTPNSSVHNSPVNSRPQSITSDHQHLHPSPVEPGLLSRMSSTSSIASRGRYRDYSDRASSRSRRAHGAHESTAEEWQRADEERIRKLIREHKEETERVNSARSSPYFGQSPDLFSATKKCPTSPDDELVKRQDSQTPSVADMSNPETPDEAVSPTHHTGQLPPALVSSSSDLGSAVSMSISNPSIPSVISEASSVSPSMHGDHHDGKGQPSSDETLNPPAAPHQYLHDDNINGYSPDHEEEAAVNSDCDEEFDSSSDSDGGLVMSRRKSAAKQGGHGVSAPLGMRKKERRGTGVSTRSKKSSRSGSNNTMKKVRTRESSDEQSRRSLDIREE